MLTNNLYHELFKLTSLPTVILSLKESVLIVVEANDAYLDFTETKSLNIQGENFLNWIENRNKNPNFYQLTDQIYKSVNEVLKTNKPNSIKLNNVELQNTPIFDVKGKVEFIVQSVKTIAVDKDKLLSTIIGNTEEAFIVLNEDLLITSFNEQFYKLYQIYFGIEIVKGNSILMYAKPNREKELKQLYKNVLSGNKEYSTIEFEHQGEIKNISVKYNPITDDNNDVIGVFIAISDETQVKKFKSQLKTQENELSFILNNLTEIVFIIGVEENIRFKFIAVNNAFIQVSGLNEDQIIGKYIEEIIPKPSLSYVIKNYIKAIATKGNVKWEETTIYPTGEKTGFVSVNPIFDDFGNCIELIGSVYDITERVKSDKLLQESEHRFKNLVHEGSDLIGILDVEGNYQYVSPTSMVILGKMPEEFIGKNAFDFIHPDDVENVFRNFSKVGLEKKVSINPFRFKHVDGTWRWLETVATDMLDEPSIKGIVANSRDVTDKIAAQKAILLSNERYKLVTKATSDAIWDWDLTTEKIYWGEGFQVIFGYQPDELTSDIKGWSAKIHPEDVERILTSINRLIDSDENNWTEEYRYLNAKNIYHYVLDKGFLIRDETGNAIRMVGALQDISKRKKVEQQLKLLESVITNTNDSIMITEAEPIDGVGPRVLYVNDAFTRLTGYTAEEVIGKTPRILQGPKTDRLELNRLKECLRNWESCEITIVNYKKNGEEFWINMSISPVADEKGWFTHWISIERDVTEQKNHEIQKILLSDISQLFNSDISLHDIINNTLQTIGKVGNYGVVEIWLIDEVNQKINLANKYCAEESTKQLYQLTKSQNSFKFGEGLPGKVWQSKALEEAHINNPDLFLRAKAAKVVNLENWIGLPLFFKDKVLGVIIFGSAYPIGQGINSKFSKNFGKFLGAEIKRKQLEQELIQFFNFAPDIIVITNLEGNLKKINPAACQLLEYSMDEFLAQPILNFIHPDDREITIHQFDATQNKSDTFYFENRYLTKSGKVIWLSWASNTLEEEGLIFSIAKDITEEKNLTDLLLKSNSMGKVGSWEIDLIAETVYWSDITREIRETDPGFIPNLETGIHYFKEGKDRDTITKKVNDCKKYGIPWDEELQIITFKGNLKWIRTIGQAEMVNGRCIRIYGSFQDIDQRKKNELKIQQTLTEIEESEKRYSDLFHLSPLPKWVYDVKTLKFLDVNKAAIKHYGYTYEEFLEMTIKDIRPVEEIAKLEPFIQENIKNITSSSEGIFIHQNKKGDKLTVEIKSNSITFKGIKAKVIAANDITERLAYLKALEQQNKKLQEISWIQSHDVRAPLSRLMGLISLLHNKTQQTELDESIIVDYMAESALELDEKIKQIVKTSEKKEI